MQDLRLQLTFLDLLIAETQSEMSLYEEACGEYQHLRRRRDGLRKVRRTVLCALMLAKGLGDESDHGQVAGQSPA